MYHVDAYDGLCEQNMSFDSMTTSSSSSLNSSILDTAHAPLCLHAESLESLEDMDTTSHDGAEFMVYKNTRDLCDDLRFVLGMPEMCDVTFVVGSQKTELNGVKAILATRSRAFYELFLSQHSKDARAKCTAAQLSSTTTGVNTSMSKPNRLKAKLMKLRRRSESTTGGEIPMSRIRDSGRLTLRITNYDADTFRKLLLYLHCGNVSVGVDSVIGLLNAADQFSVPDLHKACCDFAQRCLSLRTILPILASAEHYLETKGTQKTLTKIMAFVDENAEEILKLHMFEFAPKHTIRLVLLRKSLQARETTKLDAAMRWSRRYFAHRDFKDFRKAMKAFIGNIRLEEISPDRLMREIQPLCIVPEAVLNNAIGNRADRRRHVIGQECDKTIRQARHRPSMGIKAAALRIGPVGAPISRHNKSLNRSRIISRSGSDSDSGFVSSASSDSSSL